MPYLGDYIGSLLSEMTIARAQADGETVRLAELYADHEYLKHFPVPRVRIQDGSLEVPVVVVNTHESDEETGPRGGAPAGEVALAFDALLADRLDRLQISDQARDQIRGAMTREYQLLKRRVTEGLDAGGLARRLTKSLSLQLRRAGVSGEDLKKTLERLESDAKEELLLRAAKPSRILVGVKSSEIREANPESILRLSLKVGEEAMEWTALDEDSTKTVLTPE